MVSGVLVAESGSLVRCFGWPLHTELLAPASSHGWAEMARRSVTGIASLLIVAVVVQAWRTQREQAAVLRAATSTGILFLVESELVGSSRRVALPSFCEGPRPGNNASQRRVSLIRRLPRFAVDSRDWESPETALCRSP